MADIKVPSINLVILSGRLTAPPELRYTPSGRAVCKFGLAVSRNFKNQAGEWQEDTLFINVTTWGQLAERVNDKLTKGSPVVVEGRLQSRTWEDSMGNKRKTIEVIARSVQMLEKLGATEETYEPIVDEVPPETSPNEDDLPF